MRQIDAKQQKAYFEQPTHHFKEELLTSPEYYQQLEMDHMRKVLDLPVSSNLIDFGSGVGRISLYFLKYGYNVCAVDISNFALDFLKKKYETHRTKHWGKLTTSTTLPKKPNYDAIVGADVLHHVPLKETFFQFKPNLRPQGKIVFSEPNAYHFPWYVHYFMNGIPFDIEQGILACTKPNLEKNLRETGYHHIRLYGHGLVPTKLLSFSPQLCKWNAYALGDIPGVKFFSYRFIVSGTT